MESRIHLCSLEFGLSLLRVSTQVLNSWCIHYFLKNLLTLLFILFRTWSILNILNFAFQTLQLVLECFMIRFEFISVVSVRFHYYRSFFRLWAYSLSLGWPGMTLSERLVKVIERSFLMGNSIFIFLVHKLCASSNGCSLLPIV